MIAGATRRELFGAGVGAAVMGFGGGNAAGRAARGAEPLESILGVELLLVFAYRRVLQSTALSSGVRRTVREVLRHEQAHASVITAELIRLGGSPPPSPAGVASADQALAAHRVPGSLAGLRTERDCLQLLIAVEGVAEGAYYAALAKLDDPRLLRTAAEIMASEAQHTAALSEHLPHGDISTVVPYAFVQGSH